VDESGDKWSKWWINPIYKLKGESVDALKAKTKTNPILFF